MNLNALCQELLESRGFLHKRDIAPVLERLAPAQSADVLNGDDCAAIAQDDSYTLLAMEGFVPDFLEKMPWFAGYCGVMVNVSDIYAMGGRPLAVVDTLWSQGVDSAQKTLQGLVDASQKYGVPVVGGHTNMRCDQQQLAVAIVGKAQKLLSSFNVRAGDDLLMAVDLRGQWQEPYPYWNASTMAPGPRLRADLELLPCLAEDGLCDAAKDISMAGTLGTLLMLLDCSNMGADVDLNHIPRPPSVSLDDSVGFTRWLSAFPSYGFILSVRPEHTAAVVERFTNRELSCSLIGKAKARPQVHVTLHGQSSLLWDFSVQRFITPKG